MQYFVIHETRQSYVHHHAVLLWSSDCRQSDKRWLFKEQLTVEDGGGGGGGNTKTERVREDHSTGALPRVHPLYFTPPSCTRLQLIHLYLYLLIRITGTLPGKVDTPTANGGSHNFDVAQF